MSFVTALEAPLGISNAIKKASRATGVDFSYLLKTAARESSFNKGAKAKTSSAAGLFQFIESTWLKTVKDVGDKFGLDKYTPHIFKTRSGRYYVPNQKLRSEILQLRHNPEVSAMMAGAFTQQNADFVESQVGREPSAGELYIAHFLGAKGAAKLISLAENNPNARADRHFPAAARANKPIFYSRGRPRTVAQVYKNLVRHHQKLESASPVPVVAQAKPQPESQPAVAPLAQHFKKAAVTAPTAAEQAASVASKPDISSPARQVVPSEQDLTTLTHKVKIAPAAPVTSNELGEGVETNIVQPGAQNRAIGLAGQKAAPIVHTGRVAALTGRPIDLARASVEAAPIGSIGSWTTIVQPPPSQAAPPPAVGQQPTGKKTAQPKSEPQDRARRRTRAPSLLEQSARRAAASAHRSPEPATGFRSENFWDQISLNAS